jgi:hypothetical protein
MTAFESKAGDHTLSWNLPIEAARYLEASTRLTPVIAGKEPVWAGSVFAGSSLASGGSVARAVAWHLKRASWMADFDR